MKLVSERPRLHIDKHIQNNIIIPFKRNKNTFFFYKTSFNQNGIIQVSWPWSYGSWIYNYLCNQCLSPLMLWVRISIRARCTTLCDKVWQWLTTGWWFSPGPPVSSTKKIDRHDIAEILLKVALNTIKHPIVSFLTFGVSFYEIQGNSNMQITSNCIVIWNYVY